MQKIPKVLNFKMNFLLIISIKNKQTNQPKKIKNKISIIKMHLMWLYGGTVGGRPAANINIGISPGFCI